MTGAGAKDWDWVDRWPMKAAREGEEEALLAHLKMPHFTLSFRLSVHRFGRKSTHREKKRDGRESLRVRLCVVGEPRIHNRIQLHTHPSKQITLSNLR